jgi:hypothetical protein
MYLNFNSTILTHQPIQAISLVVWVKKHFVQIRDWFGIRIAFSIALLMLGVLWLLLWLANRNLKRQLRKPLILDNYVQLREEYDRLNLLFEQDKYLNIKVYPQKSPWFLKGVLKQSNSILSLTHQRKDAIGALLSTLDEDIYTTDLLKPISENDLWASKIKVYDYRF